MEHFILGAPNEIDGFTNSELKFLGSILQFDWVEKMKNVITFLADHKQIVFTRII